MVHQERSRIPYNPPNTMLGLFRIFIELSKKLFWGIVGIEKVKKTKMRSFEHMTMVSWGTHGGVQKGLS